MLKIPWGYKVSKVAILDTDSLANYFRRVLEKGDFSCTVYGDKGMGKSLSTIGLCRKICPDFKISEDIVFYMGDFYECLSEKYIKKWGVKILDDFGSELDARRSMESTAINFSHYFHTSRTYNQGYFITTPVKSWLNKDTRDRVANYFMEIISKNEQGGYVLAKLFYLQCNNTTNKTYRHSLCVSASGRVNNKGIGSPVSSWTLYKPDKEIEDEYLPYRLEKADRNRDKGREELNDLNSKNMVFDYRKAAKEVFDNIDSFYLTHPLNKIKYIDKGAISNHFDIGNKRTLRVVSEVKRLLAEKKTE